MANATAGVVTVRAELDRRGLQAGLNQAKRDTQRFAGDSVAAIRGIGTALATVAASAGVRSYISFLRGSAQLAQQADAANRLFEKSLGRTNQSLAEGAGLVDRLADRFGVANSVIQSSATLLLRQGASLDDIERALTAAGASAAAAGFDISTAFDNVATAVATGRSELLETSGIVTNLGPVTQQYAKSIGKTVDELTEQEVIQARVNAIYRETRQEIEDVDEILQGLPRAQAAVSSEWRKFREDVGGVAREVILPLTQGLGTMLTYVNALPEPVKRVGIAMTGAAIGATALAAGIVAIRTALTGLSALGLLSFGPAGWAVLGVTAIAGLVAVLAGPGQTLEGAANKAKDAIGQAGDRDSIMGALDEFGKRLDGPAKISLQRYAEEIRSTTGDLNDMRDAANEALSTVETAQKLSDINTQRAALEAQRDQLQLQLKRAQTAQATGAAPVDAGQALGQSILSGRGVPTAGELRVQFQDTAGLQASLDDLTRQIAALDAQKNAILNPANSTTTTSGGGGGSGGVTNLLALGPTSAEIRARVQASVGARQAADLAFGGDPYYISVARRVQEAARRREEEEEEARLRAWETIGKPAQERIARERAQREAELGGAEFPRTLSAGGVRNLLAGAAFRASVAPSHADVTASKEFVGTLEALSVAGRELATQQREDAAARKRAREEAARGQFTNASGFSITLDRLRTRGILAGQQQAAARAGQADRFEVGLDALGRRGRAASVNQAQARAQERAEANAKATAESLTDTFESATDFMNALRSGGPVRQSSLQAFLAVSGGPNGASTASGIAAGFQSGARFSGLGTRDLNRRRGEGKQLEEAADIAAKRQEAAALSFLGTVEQAGHSFLGIVKSFKEGDILGGLGGIGSLASGIISAIPGGAIAGAVLGGIGSLLPQLGDLFGGQQAEEQRRAEAKRSSPITSLTFAFNFQQSNTFQGDLTGTANQTALRQAGLMSYQDFEEVMRRSVLPRLENVEAKLGAA